MSLALVGSSTVAVDMAVAPPAVAGAPAATVGTEWLSRLSYGGPKTQVPSQVTCAWVGETTVEWLIPPGPGRGTDIAESGVSAVCNEQIKVISASISNTKNGYHITQLDAGDTNQNSGLAADARVFPCGICTGQWVLKASYTFLKQDDQTMGWTTPDCTPVADDHDDIIGYHCFGADSFLAP